MNRMHAIGAATVVAAVLAGIVAPARAAGETAAAPVDPTTQPTTIDARRLDVDYKTNVATFVGDVVVVDPQLRLTADRMVVTFDPRNNRVASIDAEGRVEIRQDDKQAHADKATYTVEDGRILLVGHARVIRDRDLLTAGQIIFFRGDDRMIAEPNPRLTLYPDRNSLEDRIFEPSTGE